ncbi:MAG: cupredoxin family copper-binding protein [Methanoregula sp.]|jgi:amicyanin|nr:cupredoxin family copper-binding protein [Methanoregula sp.]
MKNGLILLAITIILVGVCGCTQTAPPVQPPATVTTPLQTTQQLTVTTIPVPQTTSSVSANTILIKNFAFDPASITVKVGSTVRWVNQDSVPHRIVFADGADSTVLAGMQSWSRKFDQAGTYDYACTIHPTMLGTVIVER